MDMHQKTTIQKCADSLKRIKELYTDGYATKEDYTKALQSYQAYLSEIKTDQRDKATADDEKYHIVIISTGYPRD